jgi:hypothetical protein
MSRVRFVFSPAAIKDFRDIFESEKLTREAALEELARSSQHAQLQRTKSGGARVYRASMPRDYYLLADPPGTRGTSRVRALARTVGEDTEGRSTWWLQQEGDVESELTGGPGRELAFARSALGLSVEELADLIGVTARRIKKWEQDSKGGVPADLPIIARVIGRLHEARILTYALGDSGRTGVQSTLMEALRGGIEDDSQG